MSLAALQQEWQHCDRCKLCEERTKVVFGDGNPNADILVIGEAPGATEDRTGMPFQGDAGEVLNQIINALKLDRDDDLYVTNVVGCRPTVEAENDRTGEKYLENRAPSKDERDACRERLMEIIYQVDPYLIIATGKVAAQALLGRVSKMKAMRGQVFTMTMPGRHTDVRYPVMVTYHSSYLLRIHDHRPEGVWGQTLRDFLKAAEIVDYLRLAYRGIEPPDRRRYVEG